MPLLRELFHFVLRLHVQKFKDFIRTHSASGLFQEANLDHGAGHEVGLAEDPLLNEEVFIVMALRGGLDGKLVPEF